MSRTGLTALTVLATTAVLGLAGCASSGGATTDPTGSAGVDGTAVTVDSSDTACVLSVTQGPAGKFAFHVTNSGSQVTEFYVLADGGKSVAGEVEDIGPGLSRDLTVVLQAGDYTTACKPGMAGDGIQAPFTVGG